MGKESIKFIGMRFSFDEYHLPSGFCLAENLTAVIL
jgi:hypothetical protein